MSDTPPALNAVPPEWRDYAKQYGVHEALERARLSHGLASGRPSHVDLQRTMAGMGQWRNLHGLLVAAHDALARGREDAYEPLETLLAFFGFPVLDSLDGIAEDARTRAEDYIAKRDARPAIADCIAVKLPTGRSQKIHLAPRASAISTHAGPGSRTRCGLVLRLAANETYTPTNPDRRCARCFNN